MQTATDSLRTTHHASPGKQSLMPLANNAFRLLGLSCQASQREIYASASALRRAIKLGVVKPPTHNPTWLDALDQTENDVRDALSRLTVPAQRIYERLFWFFDPQAVETAAHSLATLQESAARLQPDETPAARHDIALLSLAVMLRRDPALKLADDWRRTYALWKELIEGKEFWSLLMAADLKGDFEQVTTFGEINDLRGRAWRLVTAPVAESAKDAIVREDNAAASRALAVLRASRLPQTLADEYEQEILGTVEDDFDVLLALAFSSYRAEVKSNQSVGERRETCWRAHAKFNEQVKPTLKKILELAGAESVVARRVFAAAADALDELADGFETGFDNESRLKMLRKAWQLAPPESASLLLIEEHLAGAGDTARRQPKTEADYARGLSMALREPVAQPELFTAYVQQEQAGKDLERWSRGASKFILFVMVALFVGKCFNNLPGSRRTNPYRPMNLNIALPRFTPPPMPELSFRPLVVYITVRELQTKLKAKTVTLLHVGAKGEYETGHIPGARLMPEDEVATLAKNLPKRRQIVLYCYCAGQEASARAAVHLRTLGFTGVSVLEGGYGAWRDAKLPVKQTTGLPVEPAAPPVTQTRKGLVKLGSEN
ncbi:MAG: rhodanese-like domain-containing protein [Acidobacteria bacterium]|nr:rhodanese-like domain-containing protein [Acidobacteriota bacterium]